MGAALGGCAEGPELGSDHGHVEVGVVGHQHPHPKRAPLRRRRPLVLQALFFGRGGGAKREKQGRHLAYDLGTEARSGAVSWDQKTSLRTQQPPPPPPPPQQQQQQPQLQPQPLHL